MSDSNGQRKPRMDVNLLTPNDFRRLRAKMNGRDLDDLLANGAAEDVIQTLTLGFKLREDPDFTWEQAGDVVPNDFFEMGASSGEPPPQPAAKPGSPGPAAGPKPATASKRKPRAAARGPS